MSDLGQFQGQWLGKWHGGVDALPPGFIAGNASFAINATGILTSGETVSRGRIKESFETAQADWEMRRKWREDAMQWADITPVESVQKPVQKPVQAPDKAEKKAEINLQEIAPRLNEPVLSLADLLADAKLLQLEQAQALESAMAVRDVVRMAELAYLAELAVQQEKDAIAAFLMFMD